MRGYLMKVIAAAIAACALSGCAKADITVRTGNVPVIKSEMTGADTASADEAQSPEWTGEYMKVVSGWHELHGEERAEGYGLIYLNDDDVPELLAVCEDGPYVATDIYTFIDGKACHMDLYDFDHVISEDTYTITGGQGHHTVYLEKKGYLLNGYEGGGLGNDAGYRMNGECLEQVMAFYNHHEKIDDDNWAEKHDIRILRKDGSLFEESGDGEIDFFEDSGYRRDFESEYGFGYDDCKSPDVYTFDEITEELNG